ncbi:MAG: transporter substrate-binding domain-containing protein [Enterobacterales bacterium]|nr:transporter substrate-binding domain-containing protein [Enterobacterales bacterium]
MARLILLPMAVRTLEREKYLSFTQSYLRFPLVIATHKRSPIIKGLLNLSGKRVAVEKGNPAESILKTDYPQIKIVLFDSVLTGMRDLDLGLVDALVHNSAVISHLQKEGDFEDIEIAAFTEYDLKISMAVRHDLSPLVDILQKTIRQIDKKERSSINNKWLAIQVDFGARLKRFFQWALPIVLFLILAFLYVVKTNRRLQLEISKRRRVEKSLERAKDKAILASRAKDDFLANMSHEIRTPMNAVIGMSDLLFLSNIDGTQKQYIKTLKKSSKSLLSLINQILDLSKMEAGKLQIEAVDFDLHNLVNMFSDNRRPIVEGKSVKHCLSISKNVPKIVNGDELRLQQLIENLMDNAEKYTEKGRIELSVSLTKQIENRLYLHFIVTDTGKGIDESKLSGLFDSYITSKKDLSDNKRGGGIGLAICVKLCQLMNGKIWVESKIGEGSQFHFIVEFFEPIDSIKNASQLENFEVSGSDAGNTEYLKGKIVLLVDDNKTNRLIAKKMLERAGVVVVTAKNGLECLLLLSNVAVDAVLMDLQMPVMDGFLATRKIREKPELRGLPIIALSANVGPEDVKQALDCGMDRHLPKPIVMKTLYSTLNELL